MNLSRARRVLRVLAPCAAGILLIGIAAELDARGRGGGGFRGGGGRGGGISRGGPARGGSIRHERSGGDHRSRDYDRGGSWSESRGESRWDSSGTTERDGSFENRRGETIDYSGSATRTEDGIQREGSWESSSGASGSGKGEIKIEDGQVQSRERTGHVESAQGETMDREVQSERHGDHVHREGKVETSTGVDAESKGRIQKTDDGFIAQGGVAGKEGAAGGTIARKGDQTRIRGGATDGDSATWGRARCNGSRCTGGRVRVDVDDYYRNRYYYYPYYYGWYSCPYGTRSWNNRYGTPVYGCSNVVVVHTTISLGMADTSSSSFTGTSAATSWPTEAEVSSAPVLMYEVGPQVIGYSTTYEPEGVYSEEIGGRHVWVPGPAAESPDAKRDVTAVGEMNEPTANATVITYEVDGRIVYLTNEHPVPGYYTEQADQLFAWIPGVKEPTAEDRKLVETVISAHQSGGNIALDREVRKLEVNREPPPEAKPAEAS
jgi:hypothetical protein